MDLAARCEADQSYAQLHIICSSSDVLLLGGKGDGSPELLLADIAHKVGLTERSGARPVTLQQQAL